MSHAFEFADIKKYDLQSDKLAVAKISDALMVLLADTFALYLKTKSFHWHVRGSHFRDYHLMLDEHGEQIFAMTDIMAERSRKIGGTTIRSIGHISRLQSIRDSDQDDVIPRDMLKELHEDNLQFASRLRHVHDLTSEHNDIATTSVLENWIDETEGRAWFLFEAMQV